MKLLSFALTLATASAYNDTAVTMATVTKDRANLVRQINEDPNVLWTATSYSRFEGQPVGAAKSLCGVDMAAYQQLLREKIQSGEIQVENARSGSLGASDLPTEFDSATNPKWQACATVIGDIRDQSNCGCCWAFGAAEAASDRLCIATNGTVAVPLSAQDMCFCGSSDGCAGGFPTTAWFHIEQHGLVTGGQNKGLGPFGKDGYCMAFSLPHCHHHGPVGTDPYPAENTAGCPKVNSSPKCPTVCDAGAKAPYNKIADKYQFKGILAHYPTEEALMSAIMNGGPVETAFTVYSDFENYAGGIYHKTTSHSLGGHAVRIVGWGVENSTKYWKVANSWNPYWGEKGYFRIVRGTNECGIETGAVSSPNDAKWSGPGI